MEIRTYNTWLKKDYRHSTGFPQKLALGLSVGKGLLCQINLTTFVRPWSCQWGHGLISGVSINTHYALKMPNLYIFVTQVNIMC